MRTDEFMITVAMDAFRICIGVKPRNHNIEDIIRWMRLVAALPSSKGAVE